MLDELAQELANLYSDPATARRVVQDAGIPERYIEFGGPILDVWHRIIEEADKRGLLASLLFVATREYGNNETLQQMYGTFLYPSRNTDPYPLRSEPLQGMARAGSDEPVSSRYVSGDNGYSPRLGERVAKLEATAEALKATVDSRFNNMDDKLDSITAAIAARPIPTATQKTLTNAVVGIGIGVAVLVIVLLLLWVRLGIQL